MSIEILESKMNKEKIKVNYEKWVNTNESMEITLPFYYKEISDDQELYGWITREKLITIYKMEPDINYWITNKLYIKERQCFFEKDITEIVSDSSTIMITKEEFWSEFNNTLSKFTNIGEKDE